jgi:hypothetical protein
VCDLQTQHPPLISWLCAKDFNETLFHHEKEGGLPRAHVCLDRFKGTLELCGLHDLGFVGDVFTWRNKQTKGITTLGKGWTAQWRTRSGEAEISTSVCKEWGYVSF